MKEKSYKTMRNLSDFQQQHTDENVPSQTSSQSGLILWLIVHVLRRKEQRRRDTLLNESRKNTIVDENIIPTISETLSVN